MLQSSNSTDSGNYLFLPVSKWHLKSERSGQDHFKGQGRQREKSLRFVTRIWFVSLVFFFLWCFKRHCEGQFHQQSWNAKILQKANWGNSGNGN